MDGARAITEIRGATRWPFSATCRAIILLERKVRFLSLRIELTKALQLTLHTADSNGWRRGCSGTVSTTERVRTQLTRLCFHPASSLAATGETRVIRGQARGRLRSTTTITPPAGTSFVMRLSGPEFS